MSHVIGPCGLAHDSQTGAPVAHHCASAGPSRRASNPMPPSRLQSSASTYTPSVGGSDEEYDAEDGSEEEYEEVEIASNPIQLTPDQKCKLARAQWIARPENPRNPPSCQELMRMGYGVMRSPNPVHHDVHHHVVHHEGEEHEGGHHGHHGHHGGGGCHCGGTCAKCRAHNPIGQHAAPKLTQQQRCMLAKAQFRSNPDNPMVDMDCRELMQMGYGRLPAEGYVPPPAIGGRRAANPMDLADREADWMPPPPEAMEPAPTRAPAPAPAPAAPAAPPAQPKRNAAWRLKDIRIPLDIKQVMGSLKLGNGYYDQLRQRASGLVSISMIDGAIAELSEVLRGRDLGSDNGRRARAIIDDLKILRSNPWGMKGSASGSDEKDYGLDDESNVRLPQPPAPKKA
jgi:hypothetical protein